MILYETRRLIRSNLADLALATIVSGLLFALGDMLVLTTLNLVSAASELKRESTLEIFLTDGIAVEDVEAIRDVVSGFDGVIEIGEKTPDQALEEMSSIVGDDLAEILGHNPLPYCLEARFQSGYYDVTYLSQLSAELAARDEVMEVHFASDWLGSLRRIRIFSIAAAVVLSVLISIAAFFALLAFQRQVLKKRMSVLINLQLLGFSPWALRLPFILCAAIVGIFSSSVGLILTAVAWQVFSYHVAAVEFYALGVLSIASGVPLLLAVVSALIGGPQARGLRILQGRSA